MTLNKINALLFKPAAAVAIAASLLVGGTSAFAVEVKKGPTEKSRSAEDRGKELSTPELLKSNSNLQEVAAKGHTKLIGLFYENTNGKLEHIGAGRGRGNGITLDGATVTGKEIDGFMKMLINRPDGAERANDLASFMEILGSKNNYSNSQRYSPVQGTLAISRLIQLAVGPATGAIDGITLAKVYVGEHMVAGPDGKKNVPDNVDETGKTKMTDLHSKIARLMMSKNFKNGELVAEKDMLTADQAMDKVLKTDDPSLDPAKLAYKKKCLGGKVNANLLSIGG